MNVITLFSGYDSQALDNEQWRDIEGYEGLYQVSDFGRVRRMPKGKIRVQKAARNGYLQINLSKDNKVRWVGVHRLVAAAFIPNPDSKTRRGRVQEGGTVSPTIMASQNELLRYEGIRIRRLTERELYRLMDVDEPDIDTLLAAPIPRTQHAKLAGNSIVVSCLYYIFKNLFVNTQPDAGTQTRLF